MISKIVEQLSSDISKKKDIWFLNTMEKYNLIETNDKSTVDFYRLKDEGVRILQTYDNATQIYIKEKLIGEWFDDYDLVNTGENTYTMKTNCWN